MQHAMSKAITSERKPPKERAVATVLELSLESGTLFFFRNVPRLANVNKQAVVVWKALGVTHRFLHILDQQMLVESYEVRREILHYE